MNGAKGRIMNDSPNSHQSSTQQLILREASRLFSAKGYAGTSTREIAAAVGIRQPSLFHHFPTKTAIALALFKYHRDRLPSFQGQIDLPDAPPPVRLYQALRHEMRVDLTGTYDLRGFYLTSVLDEPEFAEWKRALEDAKLLFRNMIEAGMESGDFVDQDITLVTEVFDAIFAQSLRWGPQQRDSLDPDAMAALTMRLVLKRPSRIDAIRRDADRRLQQAGINW